MCRGTYGDFQNRGLIELQNSDGEKTKLLQWTCNYCGYTMFFDPSVTSSMPYKGEGQEEVPDFEDN